MRKTEYYDKRGLTMKKDINYGLMGKKIGVTKTDFDVWVIQIKNVTCYLIEGKDQAMLIDTGYGRNDLKRVIQSISGLPLIVVNTHGHFDHIGGNGYFPEVWMGKEAFSLAKKKRPKRRMPYKDYNMLALEDGQVFDLGERQITAYVLAAHHESSFVFLDHNSGSLFTGDELEGGQVLLNVRADDLAYKDIVRKYLANMHKLKEMGDKIKRIMASHNGYCLSPSYIDDYIELCEKLLEDKATLMANPSGYWFPAYLFGGKRKLARVEEAKASFVYKKEKRDK